jgi:hypothetical protein
MGIPPAGAAAPPGAAEVGGGGGAPPPLLSAVVVELPLSPQPTTSANAANRPRRSAGRMALPFEKEKFRQSGIIAESRSPVEKDAWIRPS